MTDFHERTGVRDQLQTLYPVPETTMIFSNLLDRIDGEKAEKIVPVKRKTVWWFK